MKENEIVEVISALKGDQNNGNNGNGHPCVAQGFLDRNLSTPESRVTCLELVIEALVFCHEHEAINPAGLVIGTFLCLHAQKLCVSDERFRPALFRELDARIYPGWEGSSEESVERKYPELFKKAVALCERRGVTDPEQVVQETFLSLRYRGRQIEHKWFDASFYRRLSDRCKGEYRKEAARRRRESGVPAIHTEGDEVVDCCAMETSWVPSKQADYSEESPARDEAMRMDVREAVNQAGILTPAEERVFVLRLEGYTIEEIAERVGLSPGAIKARFSRAFPKLRRFFAT